MKLFSYDMKLTEDTGYIFTYLCDAGYIFTYISVMSDGLLYFILMDCSLLYWCFSKDIDQLKHLVNIYSLQSGYWEHETSTKPPVRLSYDSVSQDLKITLSLNDLHIDHFRQVILVVSIPLPAICWWVLAAGLPDRSRHMSINCRQRQPWLPDIGNSTCQH